MHNFDTKDVTYQSGIGRGQIWWHQHRTSCWEVLGTEWSEPYHLWRWRNLEDEDNNNVNYTFSFSHLSLLSLFPGPFYSPTWPENIPIIPTQKMQHHILSLSSLSLSLSLSLFFSLSLSFLPPLPPPFLLDRKTQRQCQLYPHKTCPVTWGTTAPHQSSHGCSHTKYVYKPFTLIWTYMYNVHCTTIDPLTLTDQFWQWQLWQVCWHRNESGWPASHRTGCASCADQGCRGRSPGGGASLSQEHSRLHAQVCRI